MKQFGQASRAMLRKMPAHHEKMHAKAPPKPPLRNAPIRRVSPYAPSKTATRDLLP